MLKKSIAFLLAVVGLLPTWANAGVYGDEFGKCLVAKSTEQDKAKLVKWIFFAISLNPEIKPHAQIAPDDRDATNKAMAENFMRLVGDSCRTEATNALKYEGGSAFEAAFQLFGQVAGQALVMTPEVSKGTEGFLNYVDFESLKKKLEVKE